MGCGEKARCIHILGVAKGPPVERLKTIGKIPCYSKTQNENERLHKLHESMHKQFAYLKN